jgi:hypothetical protein
MKSWQALPDLTAKAFLRRTDISNELTMGTFLKSFDTVHEAE